MVRCARPTTRNIPWIIPNNINEIPGLRDEKDQHIFSGQYRAKREPLVRERAVKWKTLFRRIDADSNSRNRLGNQFASWFAYASRS